MEWRRKVHQRRVTNIVDAENRGVPCGYCHNRNDYPEDPAIEGQTEQGLGAAQKENALGALHHSYFGVYSECFRAGAGVTDHERADYAREAECHHGSTGVYRVARVEVG